MTLQAAQLTPTLLPLLGPSCSTAVALLPLALHALQLSQQLEALLSGLELELFEPSELASVYFVAAAAARAVGGAWQDLAIAASGAGAVGYRLARRQEAQAIEGLCLGSLRAALLFPEEKVQLGRLLPTLGLDGVERESRTALEASRWEQRFGWLVESVKADRGVFERECKRIAGLEVSVSSLSALWCNELTSVCACRNRLWRGRRRSRSTRRQRRWRPLPGSRLLSVQGERLGGQSGRSR